MTNPSQRAIKNKQIDTIIKAFVHHLPSEVAKINFCNAMESLDREILSQLALKDKALEKAVEGLKRISRHTYFDKTKVESSDLDHCNSIAHEALREIQQMRGENP